MENCHSSCYPLISGVMYTNEKTTENQHQIDVEVTSNRLYSALLSSHPQTPAVYLAGFTIRNTCALSTTPGGSPHDLWETRRTDSCHKSIIYMWCCDIFCLKSIIAKLQSNWDDLLDNYLWFSVLLDLNKISLSLLIVWLSASFTYHTVLKTWKLN